MLQLALQFLLKNNDDDEQCLYNPEQNKTTKWSRPMKDSQTDRV